MRLLDFALSYLDRGFSVIPVRPDKKPFIKWEDFQKRKPTIEEIKEWWTRWPEAMIGIVTGTISGVVVIDVDKPEEGTRALSEYLTTSKIPTATTPRGGYHFYFKAPEKPLSNKAGTPPGCDFRGEGGYVIAPPSRNGAGKGYIWLPSLSIDEVQPVDLPSSYISFINSLALGGCGGGVTDTPISVTNRDNSLQSVTLAEEGIRDNVIFHLANFLAKGGCPEKEAFQYLEIFAKSCTPIFPLNEMKDKIKSAMKRDWARKRNMAQWVEEWVSMTFCDFSVTELFNSLQSVTSDEKANIRQILHRLCKAEPPILERHHQKNGFYRRVERDYLKIDLQSASGKPLDMRWPFGIERYYRPFAKNIVTIMGTPDAGKSAFLLNVARLNMDKFKVHYFSSEMGADELWDRLSNFGMAKEEWIEKCELIERSSNFSDVIFPDDLNIIDYLDMTGGEGKEFYKVGDFLEQIYEKLRNGIAIVGIQKDFGRDLGRGGLGTIERPRLSIAIESSKARIVKCKNWVDKKFNPNRLELEYKLVDGCKFIIQKDWH